MVAVVIGNVRTRVLIRGLGIDRALQFLRKLQREGSSHACDGYCDEHLLAATLTYMGQVSHAERMIKPHSLCRYSRWSPPSLSHYMKCFKALFMFVPDLPLKN